MVTARPRLDRKTTTLLVAGVLAVGTGGLTFNYLSSISRVQQPVSVPMRTVVVAARAIPAGSPITTPMLSTTTRPATALDPDVVTDPTKAAGHVAAVAIPIGATITQAKLAGGNAGGLAARLPRGMRAVSLAIDRVKGVSGLIVPGDRVDVIAVVPSRGNDGAHVATVLRDVPVLAMGTALSPAPSGAPASPDGPQTVTLAVLPAQARELTLVDLSATIRLALRNPADAHRLPETGEKIDLGAHPAPPAPPRVAAAPAPPAQAPTVRATTAPVVHRNPIQVIAGDQLLQ